MSTNDSDRGHIVESTGQEFDPVVHEISVMRQIILERAHALDLLRELISNSAAREVNATEIKVKYTVDDVGHVFEVTDNGCGMTFTGNKDRPGRLDKFFGLGLSSIVRIASDEFSWKGLGSKLAYHSRRIEIDTCCEGGKAHKVEINEPWTNIERNFKPKPKVFHYDADRGRSTGTTIRVFGHPPHSDINPFTFEQLEAFLTHRTFIGFTRERDKPPAITLSVLGKTKSIAVGFPEFSLLEEPPPDGTLRIHKTDLITKPGTNKSISATVKGFITWDAEDYQLADSSMNCGMFLSVRGIPYFALDMEDYGSRSMGISNPGWKKCCLVLECDAIQEDMNISRSGLVDSERVALLKQLTARMFQELEQSEPYLKFRQVPKKRKLVTGANDMQEQKAALESSTQKWVVWRNPKTNSVTILGRVPENENDTLTLLYKLEALDALPFRQFQTLAHAGQGCDLIVHFQEDEQSTPERFTSIEAERFFTNYKAHGHTPSQYPRIICWDLGSSPKMRLNETNKVYKRTAEGKGFQVHVFLISKMEGVTVLTKAQLDEKRT